MTRPDAEVVAEWGERAAILEHEARLPRSVAEDRACLQFLERDRLIVDRHLAAIRAARGAKQASLF